MFHIHDIEEAGQSSRAHLFWDDFTTPEDTKECWVFEFQNGRKQWVPSMMNVAGASHTLEWCLETWKFAARKGKFYLAHRELQPYDYRLRNVKTEEIIMGAVLRA